MSSPGKVAIIGSGLIGRSYAMIFASGGYEVYLYDLETDQVTKAKVDIEEQLKVLEKQKLLRGSLSRQEQCDLIKGVTDLGECVKDAFFVQECVPEKLSIKRLLWAEVDKLLARDDVILSSSTSALRPSDICEGLTRKDRFIVSHPTNPPFYAPLVEVIPSKWTQPEVVSRTMELLSSVGQVPVLIKKEVDGFVLNRIQYAIFAEAWRLIRDGVISPEDLDKVMSSGLGTRYAFMGPLETAYLNAEGMDSYVERYADMIYGIQLDQGAPEKMAQGPTLETIKADMQKVAGPVEDIQTRRAWRDRRLAALTKLKADMKAIDESG